MDPEEHYDTPWEFKNKAIAAVLGAGVVSSGSSNGQLSKSPKATDENFLKTVYPIQPSSSQPTPANYLNDHNRTTKQSCRVSHHQPTQRLSPPHQRRFSTTSCESRQNLTSQPLANKKDRSRLSFERIAKPILNPSSRVPYVSNSPLSPGPSTAQWTQQPVASAIVYPLVGKMTYEKEPKMNFIERNGLEFFQPNHSRKSTTFDEASMVHEGMERVLAEQLLKPMDVGDFLLRRRNEGNLALSLRSLDGVLHIKLEMRDALWVLGEGPKFSSISGMLRCYRKNELPVRGAEHVRLKSPLTTAEVAMVMQSTRRKSQSP